MHEKSFMHFPMSAWYAVPNNRMESVLASHTHKARNINSKLKEPCFLKLSWLQNLRGESPTRLYRHCELHMATFKRHISQDKEHLE